jgi:peptidoglycan hydrolase-like protein with peptidoglycan-binding domain
LHPTAKRYKEIQQALANKGYYRGEIDGKWGPGSTSALQRFQTDQGIENEGKITALALIGLGLGPKHLNALQPGASPEERSPADDSEISEREQTPTSPRDDDPSADPPRVN